MTSPADLIRALKEVPEQKLKLLDLARESVEEDGSLDTDMLAYRHKEVKEAADEAESYSMETRKLVSVLKLLFGGA